MNSIHQVWEEEMSAQTSDINRERIGEGPLTQEQEIYKENILDHYRHPHNFGKNLSCTFSHHEHNPLCGDQIEIFVDVEDGHIAQILFNGRGCAISQASASMLTDYVKGKFLSEVKQLSVEDVLGMLGIPLGPVRLKCALLALKTLIEGIHQHEEIP